MGWQEMEEKFWPTSKCVSNSCLSTWATLFSNQWEPRLASLHKTGAREVADRTTENQCTQNHCLILKMCSGERRKKKLCLDFT